MLGWTNFQKQNYGVHNKYECKKLSKEMIIACTKLLRCVKDNNIPFKERPLISENYADTIKSYPREFGSDKIRESHLRGWLNDPKYLRAMSLPIREISYIDLPDAEINAVFSALKAEENVYEDAIILRIVKLAPGDSVMLHYDPKTFYTPNKLWQRDHVGKYKDKRAFVYMHDRMPGQVSYLGNKEIDYKQYEMYKFDVDKLYHGAANYGYDDRIMICFSWAEPI